MPEPDGRTSTGKTQGREFNSLKSGFLEVGMLAYRSTTAPKSRPAQSAPIQEGYYPLPTHPPRLDPLHCEPLIPDNGRSQEISESYILPDGESAAFQIHRHPAYS